MHQANWNSKIGDFGKDLRLIGIGAIDVMEDHIDLGDSDSFEENDFINTGDLITQDKDLINVRAVEYAGHLDDKCKETESLDPRYTHQN